MQNLIDFYCKYNIVNRQEVLWKSDCRKRIKSLIQEEQIHERESDWIYLLPEGWSVKGIQESLPSLKKNTQISKMPDSFPIPP